MSRSIVVTGTDTGIGKTVFSAGLVHALNACYWKPVQSGLEEETDSQCVQRLAQVSPERIVPEQWRLALPASPHLSAEREGVQIDAGALVPPMTECPLVIEGAGGLLVPLTRTTVFADVFVRWQLPVILCARTALGTINHTLLTLEALRARKIPVAGVAFMGEEMADSQKIICEMGRVSSLGRLPRLDPLTPQSLHHAFHENFDLSTLRECLS